MLLRKRLLAQFASKTFTLTGGGVLPNVFLQISDAVDFLVAQVTHESFGLRADRLDVLP